MGLSGKGWTSQVELTVAKTAQEVDPKPQEPATASLAVKAASKNKGALFLGFSKAEVEAEKGFELSAGESITLDITGPGRLWFNGANEKDKLCLLGLAP